MTADDKPAMTPEQIELARHALGLQNGRRVSYRNHFVTGAGSSDYDAWMAMTEAGFATRRDGKNNPLFGGDDLFRLTREGATAALRKGERLDPAGFQEARQ